MTPRGRSSSRPSAPIEQQLGAVERTQPEEEDKAWADDAGDGSILILPSSDLGY